MSLSNLIIWCLVTFTTVAAQFRENGILYDHTAKMLRPWDIPDLIQSNNFPKEAPHDLVQTWRYLGVQRPGESTGLQIICNKISIAKVPGSNDCGKFKLTIENGNKKDELCGDVAPFKMVSDTEEIKFELRTGPYDGGIVDCSVQAVPVTSDRTVITTTTTTTTTTPPPPKPTLPAYLTFKSQEVDSSEHGGEAGAKTTTCHCGWSNKATSRIVNGTVTNKNEFPFMAGVVFTYQDKSKARFCGATIITKRHLLTAAHCTFQIPAGYLSVYVGAHDLEKGDHADEIPVAHNTVHPNYNSKNWANDIAMLILDREIKYTQFVGPACFPPKSPRLDIDRQYVKIIGWGAIVYEGRQSTILHKVDVRIVPMKECNYVYPIVNADKPTQICTYSTMKASCQGDSGGPVVWLDPETNRYTLVGIVSFARICGDRSPTVHTSPQAHYDWIHYHIKASNMPNSETCMKID